MGTTRDTERAIRMERREASLFIAPSVTEGGTLLRAVLDCDGTSSESRAIIDGRVSEINYPH